VKRAPTAKKVRKTFEVPGPAAPGAPSLDARAAQIFGYFKRYNYAVKGTGEVITFEGVYAPDKGQAAAVTFYTFAGGDRDRQHTAHTAACSSICHSNSRQLPSH
jgi:hypothetical protein